ncbi:MAG: AMP-binding protein [Betaproteobacteria bacterium]|nr:AMP-binding protein [Betaproteobacteria bacterium]
MLTMPSLLQRTSRVFGANIAIRDAEGDLTWADYVARIACAAGVLRSLGLRPGERYAILCRNSVRHAELIHAGYWMGAVPVPVNYRLAPAEIALVLEDAECRLLAIEDVFGKMLEHSSLQEWRSRAFCVAAAHTGAALPLYDSMRDQARAVEPHEAAEDDDAILLYTGGTTSRGKGVRITHRNIVSNALQLARAMSVGERDVYLHVSPMFHSTDLKATALSMMGASHTYLAEFSPASVLAAIERYGVTISSLVPTMIIRTLQEGTVSQYNLGTLRLLSYGTSPMAPEWIRRTMEALPGVDLHQCYGLTETAPVLAILDAADHRRALEGREGLLRSVGRPLPGVDIRIVDESRREVAPGESGEIVTRGPQIAKGYHNRPRENAEVFRDGWFHTGDIGRMDEEGYLFVLDRKKDMVVTGGENVYTSEVEAAICQHPGVQEVAVFGVPDERYGEALFAVIVPSPGHKLSTDEMIAHCRKRIGGYKIPRRMAFVDALPRSAIGKIMKQDLRRIYGSGAPTLKKTKAEPIHETRIDQRYVAYPAISSHQGKHHRIHG